MYGECLCDNNWEWLGAWFGVCSYNISYKELELYIGASYLVGACTIVKCRLIIFTVHFSSKLTHPVGGIGILYQMYVFVCTVYDSFSSAFNSCIHLLIHVRMCACAYAG